MKTIGLEVSKKLNDLGLLDNVETEYGYDYDNENKIIDIIYYFPFNKNIICKTLTLEEAIQFFVGLDINKDLVRIDFNKDKTPRLKDKYGFLYGKYGGSYFYRSGKTPLAAIEDMLEYLLENGLLNKN